MTRHELREAIFKTVFQMPFFEEGIPELSAADEIAESGKTASSGKTAASDETASNAAEDENGGFISDFISEYNPSNKDKVYIMSKVKGISDNLSSIDESIEKNSNGWKLNRIGKAELAILRVAVFEILYDSDIPDKVAINEAVELAKEYADPKSAAFINGVLSGLVF